MADDVGWFNIGAYHRGMMAGRTPNLDRLASEGMMFTDYCIPAQAPTIATALRAQGYATGQFGKNHFGDRNEYLPTLHGFDEFWGYRRSTAWPNPLTSLVRARPGCRRSEARRPSPRAGADGTRNQRGTWR
jgi:arylsulfatase A-like enzyme